MSKQYVQMMVSARMAGDETGEINIYGYITSYKWSDNDVTAMDIKKELEKVKDAKKLRIHINSPGGSLYQGLSIMDNLKAHKATVKEGYIEGLCASAATLPLIPMTRRFAYEGSEIMIHNPSGIGWGTAKELQKAAESLLKSQKNICKLYASMCKKDEAEIQQDMDDEKWLTADEAIDYGFVDEVIPIVEDSETMSACITKGQMMMLGYKQVPDTLMQRLPEKEPDKTNETAAATALSDKVQKGENTTMTKEELRKQHPEMVAEIESDAIKAERQRMQDIDEVALPGYEEMAADAKYKNPIDAANFSMQQTKAMKAKGPAFMQQRQTETAVMKTITPDAPPAATATQAAAQAETAKMEADAKQIAQMADQMNRSTVQVAK